MSVTDPLLLAHRVRTLSDGFACTCGELFPVASEATDDQRRDAARAAYAHVDRCNGDSRSTGSVHWYYPSGIIPCDLKSVDSLLKLSGVITHERSKVTCETCKARLEADKAICARCGGNDEAPHACDPGRP